MLREKNPNVEVVTAAVDAINRRDKETIGRFVSEDVVYTIYGRGPNAGVYKGIEGFQRLIDIVSRLGLTSKPVLFVAEGEYLFLVQKLTGRREGKSLETENCYLFRIKNGKVVEGRNIPTDQYAFDEYCR